MGIPLTIAVALFGLMGLGLMLAWVASHRQPGLFLGALAYGVSVFTLSAGIVGAF